MNDGAETAQCLPLPQGKIKLNLARFAFGLASTNYKAILLCHHLR